MGDPAVAFDCKHVLINRVPVALRCYHDMVPETLVRQLIGTDPGGELFPSTFTARTEEISKH